MRNKYNVWITLLCLSVSVRLYWNCRENIFLMQYVKPHKKTKTSL